MRFSPDVGCWAPPLYVLTGVLSTYIGNAVLCARRVLTWFAVVAAAHNCLWRSQPIFGWEKFLRPYFFSYPFFFPLPRYTPRTATIGRMKKKEGKKLLYNLPLLPNSFPPIVSRCLGFFPVSSIYSLLSILYWGRIATALRARNLSWRSYPTQRIAI